MENSTIESLNHVAKYGSESDIKRVLSQLCLLQQDEGKLVIETRDGVEGLFPLSQLCLRPKKPPLAVWLSMIRVLIDVEQPRCEVVGEAIFGLINEAFHKKNAITSSTSSSSSSSTTTDTLEVIDFLLQSCPDAACYQDSTFGNIHLSHFVVRYVTDENICTRLLSLLLNARKGILYDKKDVDGWPTVHHAALKRSLGVMKYLIEACPAAAFSVSTRGSTLFHIVLRSFCQKDVGEKIAYLCSDPRFAPLLRMQDCFGLSPLHTALHRPGVSLDIIKTLCDATPDAPCHPVSTVSNTFKQYTLLMYNTLTFPFINFSLSSLLAPRLLSVGQVLRADTSSSWHLALPLHLAVGHLTLHSPISPSADIFRYLLKLYPAAAMMADGRGNTPYALAIRNKVRNGDEKHIIHPYFVRLLLRACPTLNPTELHRINYEERRMGLFLGLCGKTNNVKPALLEGTEKSVSISNQLPFSIWSCRRFSDDLFRYIVTFL